MCAHGLAHAQQDFRFVADSVRGCAHAAQPVARARPRAHIARLRVCSGRRARPRTPPDLLCVRSRAYTQQAGLGCRAADGVCSRAPAPATLPPVLPAPEPALPVPVPASVPAPAVSAPAPVPAPCARAAVERAGSDVAAARAYACAPTACTYAAPALHAPRVPRARLAPPRKRALAPPSPSPLATPTLVPPPPAPALRLRCMRRVRLRAR
eukprot:1591210-Pleurochrysis_carterae.AAC.1